MESREGLPTETRSPSPERAISFEKALPDLVVYTERINPQGTPEIVLQRLADMKKRAEIESMWLSEHSETYLPLTETARKLKLSAKLRNRAELRHAEIVKRRVLGQQRGIELDFDETIRLQAEEVD